jgi:ribosomal-protein-alanine N-acetyltransferase
MSPAWQLRQGREDDIRAMYMLDLVCFDEPFRFTLPAMRRFVQQPGAIVLVAEAQTRLVGFIVVHLVRKKTGYIVTLDVAAEFRRMGIAAALVRAAERQVRDCAAPAMALHVSTANAPAIAFYERTGYIRLEHSPGFYSAGHDAFTYRKELGGGGPA